VRGVVEVSESADDEAALATLSAAMLKGLDAALEDLIAARLSEGAALQKVLSERVEKISALTDAAESAPGRKPEAVRARLQQAVEALTGASPALDPARLHQEAVLIAAKADVNARASDGETPLALAYEARQLDTLKLLMATGADPALPNAAGKSPKSEEQQQQRTTRTPAKVVILAWDEAEFAKIWVVQV
jgi:hypothetical protein